MCALCGVLGGAEHWAGAHARPGSFTRNTSPLERRRERARRVVAANRVLGAFGLADPLPALTTLTADPVLRHHVRSGAIVATVDAVNLAG